jgi:PAS domain-containing protein
LETGYLHYTTRVICEDSSIHWAELKGKVFYNSKNEPIKILGTIRDISEERFSQQLLIER